MSYRLHPNPKGPTRQLGARGALRQATFVRYEKAPSVTCVESGLEAAAGKLLDLSHEVTGFEYQPFTLDIAHDKMLLTKEDLKRHREALRYHGAKGWYYTPDFKVYWHGEAGPHTEIQEWKDSNWLPNEDDEYTEKLAVSCDFFGSHGMDFNMYEFETKKLSGSPLFSNINKLHSLKTHRQDPLRTLSPGYIQYLDARAALHATVNEAGAITLAQLSSSCRVDLTTTWHLLVDEEVYADLASAPLNHSTVAHAKDAGRRSSQIFKQALLTLQARMEVSPC